MALIGSVTSANIASPVFTGTAGFPDGSASTPSIYNVDDTNNGIFFPETDVVAFANAGSETARFHNNGRFGLGTSDPQTKMDVRGNLYVDNGTITSSNRRFFQTVTGTRTAASSGTWRSIAYVDHHHCIRIFISVGSVANECSGGTWIGSSNFVCGSGSITQEATQVYYSGSGTNLSSISVQYLNGSGEVSGYPNYNIQVRCNYTGTVPEIFYAIQGISGVKIVPHQD
jgi:hypothetical protein